MHKIQEQLLELSQKYDLKKMGLRQIGRLINVDHPQKVKFHMKKLGLLEGEHKKFRSLIKRPSSKKSKVFFIPIVGLANCGDASVFAESKIENMLPVSSKLISTNHTDHLFAVKAVGSSMNHADINGKSIENGDYVIIDSEDKDAKNNDYVLSIINGLANIKKFIKDDQHNQIILKSESDKFFPPIHIHEDDLDDYIVNGKVIQVVKSFKGDDFRYEPLN